MFADVQKEKRGKSGQIRKTGVRRTILVQS